MNKLNSVIVSIIKHQFFTGSLIMVFGSNAYNLSQFLYHFLAGRFLGKASYGDLAAIISILGFLGVVQLSFNLTIVKFISSQKDAVALQNFIKWVYKWSVLLGLVVSALILLLSTKIASFFQISEITSILLLAPILLMYIIVSTGRSILQGLLRFDQFVYSLLVEAFGKLIFLIIFLVAGYALFGSLGAFLIGTAASFLIIIWFTRKYLTSESITTPNVSPFIKYSVAVLIQGLALTSMYSTDLLIVKHFFVAEQAGLYAALAILGRIVFFGASPVLNVMFPIVSKKHLNGENYNNVLYLSIFFVLGFSSVLTFLYWLMPTIPLGLLYGQTFLEGAHLLWYFGVSMTLLNLSMLLTQFYLSINHTKPVYLFAAAAILQAIFIWFYHDSLFTVVKISIGVTALLVSSLSVYFFYIKHQNAAE